MSHPQNKKSPNTFCLLGLVTLLGMKAKKSEEIDGRGLAFKVSAPQELLDKYSGNQSKINTLNYLADCLRENPHATGEQIAGFLEDYRENYSLAAKSGFSYKTLMKRYGTLNNLREAFGLTRLKQADLIRGKSRAYGAYPIKARGEKRYSPFREENRLFGGIDSR